MNPKVKKIVPLVLYALFILGISSIPGKKLTNSPSWMKDKAVHFILYTGAGLAFFPTFAAPLPTAVATYVMGAIDENYQRLTPDRTCDFRDWIADILGGTFGTLIAYAYAKRQRYA